MSTGQQVFLGHVPILNCPYLGKNSLQSDLYKPSQLQIEPTTHLLLCKCDERLIAVFLNIAKIYEVIVASHIPSS